MVCLAVVNVHFVPLGCSVKEGFKVRWKKSKRGGRGAVIKVSSEGGRGEATSSNHLTNAREVPKANNPASVLYKESAVEAASCRSARNADDADAFLSFLPGQWINQWVGKLEERETTRACRGQHEALHTRKQVR